MPLKITRPLFAPVFKITRRPLALPSLPITPANVPTVPFWSIKPLLLVMVKPELTTAAVSTLIVPPSKRLLNRLPTATLDNKLKPALPTLLFALTMSGLAELNAGGNTPGAKLYGPGNVALVLIGLLVKPRVNPLQNSGAVTVQLSSENVP